MNLEQIFLGSKLYSVKWSNYFKIYETLFSDYIGKEITFVEIGVLNGGSLLMWREFFGPEARIIGIDNNPRCKDFEKLGDFEIFIGDQGDPIFWETLKEKEVQIDLLLDDGGHTNRQQIVTTFHSLDLIKDGGLIIVEDTHASYMKEFGNPSKYSFSNTARI
jgi:cephalosporin hydroxylase